MIKLERIVLTSPEQIKFIIEGMRNPLNSWDRSDSYYDGEYCDICEHRDSDCDPNSPCFNVCIGENDLSLMRRLSKSGTDHRKFMRMMPVYVRITAPLYWWKEFDTYKVGTVANSCSTMHKIQEKEFTMADFSYEHLCSLNKAAFERNILGLNEMRNYYLNWDSIDDEEKSILGAHGFLNKKDIWWQMIQLLPSSYNQIRNCMLNYEVLANIYKSRRGHKLDEWIIFCMWIETLPYSELITGESTDEK